ncbi:protein-tyrosine phosphatase family protein [Salinigranum rubrum]|uniref:protein-tyrosine phosphatase family protein n=1 Tax=Salinigranum rubrum TaxID=755307 RepID=UPI0013A53D9E|nr:dual specificity protein phosphatase family protein [Salinigranum rubrum]
MDHVTDSLLVGDADDASDHAALRAEGVTAVLSLTHDSPARPATGYAVLDRPLIDGPRHDAADFATAVDDLRSLLAEGERVLVHCSAGASRSVAVAAAALALVDGVESATALERVSTTRGVSGPHPALADRVRQYVASERVSG